MKRRRVMDDASALSSAVGYNESNAIATNSSTLVACPCDIVYNHYNCIAETPKLGVTGIELRWCLKSSLEIGALQSLVVTHGRHVSVRIHDSVARYESFPTTIDRANHVIRVYMGNGFGPLVKRGFRAIVHPTLSIDGTVNVGGELQSFSITFPVKSIRFLPILKGRGWEYPGSWRYWVIRFMFFLACLFVPCSLFCCIRILWFWKPMKTLSNLYDIPETAEIPVSEQAECKNNKANELNVEERKWGEVTGEESMVDLQTEKCDASPSSMMLSI